MSQQEKHAIAEILAKHEDDLLADWAKELAAAGGLRGTLSESQVREQCREFLALVREASGAGGVETVQSTAWNGVRQMLAEVSRARSLQGYSPSDTASFVFSLKKPLFARLRREYAKDADALGAQTWAATEMLDKLGLFTTEIHQKAREEVITQQQHEMLELSTPVVKLWDGILALPMIGTLDSSRTQIVMESLLQKIAETGAGIAILDITGVPTVDTLTAQYLLKTVAAARLMGAECIISGIRPQIAQTIVHLGVELGNVITKATLADAFAIALQRTGRVVARTSERS